MVRSTRLVSRSTNSSTVGGVFLTVVLLAAGSPAQGQYAVPPIDEGQAYYMATHGFGALVAPDPDSGAPGPLDILAAEAELAGHRSLGLQLIAGSTPMQHWSQGDGDESQNLAKVALRAGGVDVFGMSPNAVVPEEGIDLFGDLVLETNPAARILVQSSWAPWDGNGSTTSVGGAGAPDFSNEDHDRADFETLQGWINQLHADDGYLERLRAQLMGINQRAGRMVAFVVPAADAVYRLRQEVLLGRIPGVEKQSELFVDAAGNAAGPTRNLVSYLWFTVMYRQPASGLQALVDVQDPTSAERERLLQQIAWEVAAAEPLSGVTAPVLWPEGARSMHDLLHGIGADEDGMEHMEP